MENKEIWKPVVGYEGLYEVSSLGRVRCLDKMINYKDGRSYIRKGHLMRPSHNSQGYENISLTKEKEKKSFKVHRLVAEAFIPNPANYPIINHKNEIKDDNRVENLEWCDYSYNVNYNNNNKRIGLSLGRPIIQLTIDGEYVNSFPSAEEASRQTYIQSAHIGDVLRFNRWTAGGYCWAYKEEYEKYF